MQFIITLEKLNRTEEPRPLHIIPLKIIQRPKKIFGQLKAKLTRNKCLEEESERKGCRIQENEGIFLLMQMQEMLAFQDPDHDLLITPLEVGTIL